MGRMSSDLRRFNPRVIDEFRAGAAIGVGGERAILARTPDLPSRYLQDAAAAELLQRAVELYDVSRLDFAGAYLIAVAERTGVGVVAPFNHAIDGVGTVRRHEPL